MALAQACDDCTSAKEKIFLFRRRSLLCNVYTQPHSTSQAIDVSVAVTNLLGSHFPTGFSGYG